MYVVVGKFVRPLLASKSKSTYIMSHYYSRYVTLPFDDAVTKLTSSLQQQGFGVITTIDMKETLKQKLNVDFRRYKILGTCNPEFAHKAINLESHVGLMLPCNLVVQEHDSGEVEISAINPLETIDHTTTGNKLTALATEVGNRLRAAIDQLHAGAPVLEHSAGRAIETESASARAKE